MDIEKKCIMCGEQHIIKVNSVGYQNWKKGMHIQTALPKVSVDDREMLISGICGKCFDKMFAE